MNNSAGKRAYLRLRARARNFYLEKIPFSSARRSMRRVGRIELGPDSVVLDLGANVGQFTEFFCRSGARVIAYEPHPGAHAKLVDRVSRFENVDCREAAVGTEPGSMFLHAHENEERDSTDWSQGSSLIQEKCDVSGTEGHEVKVVDVAEVVRELGHIDLVKIDIEGAEVGVLNRILDEGLEDRIGHLFCETHEEYIPALAADTAALRERISARGLSNWDLDWH